MRDPDDEMTVCKRAIRGEVTMGERGAWRVRSRWILLAVALVVLGACGGGGDDATEPTATSAAPTKNVTLPPTTTSTADSGDETTTTTTRPRTEIFIKKISTDENMGHCKEKKSNFCEDYEWA